MNEQFSAFLDGEAARDEADSVVNALLRDGALRASWTRQHWVRTTLRAHSAEPAVALDAGFADRVMKAIESGRPEAGRAVGGRVASLPPQSVSMGRARRGRRWRGVAGLAAAASVAGVVFLVGGPLVNTGQRDSRMAHAGGAASGATQSVNAGQAASISFGSGGVQNQLADFSSIGAQRPGGSVRAVAVSASRARAPAAGGDSAAHWSVSDPAVRNELNGYLVDHDGMARGYGLSSTTPGLVRVATYGPGAPQ